MVRNRLCEILQIQYPIIQAPMNWVSGADLVAAVSNAGGLGTLGPNSGAKTVTRDVERTGERMRRQIQKVRRLTDKPFAVNVIVGMGESLRYSKKVTDVLIEEAVPAAIVSVGRPDIYTRALKRAGIKVLHAISTVRHGRKAEDAGVDAVICEGFEAGGHKGFAELTTFTLTPMVSDELRIPVIAGGGIGDARGILAAFSLGADGVYMGTRFMVTRESESHPAVKQAVIEGEDVCTVSVSKEFMLARDLRNQFTRSYTDLKSGDAGSEELNRFLKDHSQYHAQSLGCVDEAEICCGQVAGLITDCAGAGAVVNDLVKNIDARLKDLKQRLSGLL